MRNHKERVFLSFVENRVAGSFRFSLCKCAVTGRPWWIDPGEIYVCFRCNQISRGWWK